ncbi:hypothetical protein OG739_20205 [Streptomyces longwoodensis]|uniref:hypothetical protein n=1 Tax=Streptomyces longwoodensis TaxID=68231 RepID=UPI003250E99D
MSSSTADSSAGWHDNPFPASAVARYSPVDGAGLNIVTPAVAQALSYVDGYLDSPGTDQAHQSGNVIAIVGEYGTGKTHLSIELLRRIKRDTSEDVHSFYLDAPADTFLALYRDRFFAQLDRKDVRQRVAEYYADIVAEELGDSPLTEEVARLLKERQVQPHSIVQELGLSQSSFQQELQERLGRITEHEDFGTALGLFLRPEFEAAVWEWLAGHPADAVLRERGIQRTIDNDISALEAIGVFAFLYGRQDHRFVLIIDEFEKVLSRTSRSVKSEASVLAFKKLLEVFAQARSLLILGGLPDFMEVLPEDAKQRISCIVRPTALSFADAKQYIKESLGRQDGDLSPFNEDSIAYLVELAGGNARKVIRLCYHAYEASARGGADLTRAMVRQVAREQFEVSSPDDVRSEVARILDSNGWAFESPRQITDDPLVVVDYWLPVGQNGGGCAILITQSVLHENEARELVLSARAIHSKNSSIPMILVVNGYLAEPLHAVVASEYSRVMQYAPLRFSDDFTAAINAFIRRLEETLSEDRLSLVESKLEQLLRQTSGVRKSLEELQQTSAGPGMIENAVDGGLRRVFGALSGGAPDGSGFLTALSPSTDELFRSALRHAESIAGVWDAELRSIFRRVGDPDPLAPGPAEVALAVGNSQGLVVLIKAFRDAIIEILMKRDLTADRMTSEPNYRYVADVCRTYDTAISDVLHRIPAEPGNSSRIASFGHNLRELAERVWDSLRRL